MANNGIYPHFPPSQFLLPSELFLSKLVKCIPLPDRKQKSEK